MGKNLKKFLIEEEVMDEECAQEIVGIVLSVRAHGPASFGTIARDREIFKKIKIKIKNYQAVDKLGGNLNYLSELGLIKPSPTGLYSLTDKGKKYFQD